MEKRLSRGEYWLLNSVVEASYPLLFLDGPDRCAEVYNRTGHGLTRVHLIRTLSDLFNRGWITAHIGGMKIESQPLGCISKDSIERALSEASPMMRMPCTYYKLTSAGAAVWEEFASPEWDRFIDYGIRYPGEFIGATEWRIRKYFDLVHHVGIEVMPATVVWDTIQPWQATYWKSLPIGYRVRFEHSETVGLTAWERVPHEIMSLQRWYDWE